jgi:metal-responsive CopG/Arc/MetJ family transcriptional regulator
MVLRMSKLLSVSLPDDLVEETDAFARALGKTRSEVVRDALRRYLGYARLSALQEFGREQAVIRGIEPDDTEALVDAMRAARR